jgi:hypothetical protein
MHVNRHGISGATATIIFETQVFSGPHAINRTFIRDRATRTKAQPFNNAQVQESALRVD